MSMEAGKNSRLLEHDRFPPGAIFMSNRTTKKECFRLKLFGLPSSHASFVKKINVGMILFLFEYEQRKLYGVFEATSDGSTDIIPTAFVTSGKEFSAQVRFRTIWYCDPLPEAEFRDAIKENYYAPKKFQFELSETQVCKLLCLFDSKKTKIQQFYSGGSNLTLELRSWGMSDNEKHKSMLRKLELKKETNSELGVFPDFSSLHRVVRHERYSLPPGSSGVALETALQPTVSVIEESKRPVLINPTSRDILASGKNLITSQDHYSYQLSPYLQLRSPVNTGMGDAFVDAVDSYPSDSPLRYPFPRGQYHISQPDCGHLTTSNVHKSMGVHHIPLEPSYKNMGIRHIPQESSYPVGVSSCGLLDSTSRNFLSRVDQIELPSSSHEFNDPGNPEILYSSRGGYMNVHHRDVSTRVHVLARPDLLSYNLGSLANDNSEGPKSLALDPRDIIPRSRYEQNGLKISESWFHSSQERGLSRIQYSGGFSEHQYEGPSSHQLYEDDEYYHVAASSRFHLESHEKRCYEGSSSHQLNEDDEYYHAAASSRFHLESHEKRSSVFSRLSGPRKSSAGKTVTFKHNLEVLVDCPARKRSSRIMMTQGSDFKDPKKATTTFKKMRLAPDFQIADGVAGQTVVLDDDDEQLEHPGPSDPKVDSLQDGESSSNQEANENSTVRPFVNFKRRSEAQRTGADQRETSSSVQQTEADVSRAKPKRKKLQRPSLVEEDPSGNNAEMQNLLEPHQQPSVKEQASESGPSVANESVHGTGGEPPDEHLMRPGDDVRKVTSLSGGDGATSEGQMDGLGGEESSHQGPVVVSDDASERDASEGEKSHGGDHSETPERSCGPQRGRAAVRGTRSSPRLAGARRVLQERQAASRRASTAPLSPQNPEPPEEAAV